MNIFDFRDGIIGDYSAYISSFIEIRDERIRKFVHDKLDEETLWPKPLLQLNPSYEPGESIPQMIAAGLLHPECENIFRRGKDPQKLGSLLQLHRHQSDALRVAQKGHNYVLTTGTGSGKSLAYIVPIVDHVHPEASLKGHARQAAPHMSGPEDVDIRRRLQRFNEDLHLASTDQTGFLSEVIGQVVLDPLGLPRRDGFPSLAEGVVLVAAATDRADGPPVGKHQHLRADPLWRRPG